MTNPKKLAHTLATVVLLSVLWSTESSPCNACQTDRGLGLSKIKRTIPKLRTLHTRLEKPKAGDWLETHREKGQTFSQYRKSKPNVLSGRRRKLYVQPIGDFTETDNGLISTSAEFLSIYFQCEVIVNETLPESVIPDSAQRTHPSWGVHQLLTSHILEQVLAPELPADAFATIAFTKSDLWPGEGWSFVFGYASFRERVGVWSLARFGDPEDSDEVRKQCLLRTIKVATHETGHMFSIEHCTKYRCNMQGSNSLEESDSQPIYLCPECHAKILFAANCLPTDRYKKLIEFCEQHDLADEKEYFQRALSRVD
ncbi:archaemetzincin [Mariniblastus fucicola]|uniref:Peptidase family M54 n=1 Tax=Mariniblastus fucicola TaxID=980251 RepID=A0A5B9PIY8_9BACT|nr:archaemetzincin [Mariniblastus fucicola]QEG25210.1 Peptidase family M54 [Mariniblastus fucicola]